MEGNRKIKNERIANLNGNHIMKAYKKLIKRNRVIIKREKTNQDQSTMLNYRECFQW